VCGVECVAVEHFHCVCVCVCVYIFIYTYIHTHILWIWFCFYWQTASGLKQNKNFCSLFKSLTSSNIAVKQNISSHRTTNQFFLSFLTKKQVTSQFIIITQYHISFTVTVSICTKQWLIKVQEKSLCSYYCSIAVDYQLNEWVNGHISMQTE